MGWRNHIDIIKEDRQLHHKEQYENFSKPYLELEINYIPIKYAVEKYKKDNESDNMFNGIKLPLFHPLPSDKWILDYVKNRIIFKPTKIKNKWYCNKNAIDMFSFREIKP